MAGWVIRAPEDGVGDSEKYAEGGQRGVSIFRVALAMGRLMQGKVG